MNEIKIQDKEEPPSSEEPPGCKNWHWQFKHRLTYNDLIQRGIEVPKTNFPVAITPYYFSLIKKYDDSDPIFKMCIPQEDELTLLNSDPLCEDSMSPVSCLVHRYRDRALIISTTTCATYCRYCTRKRKVGIQHHTITLSELHKITEYLSNHQEVSDVIISGGDPLTFETDKLEKIISVIRDVPSVEIIRIGTKVPVVMPMRINKKLVKMLKQYQPIFVNTHFNHPQEITRDSKMACAKLIDHGIPIGNQSVLLKGINDDKHIQEELCRKLIRMRVKPYYLYQCDLIDGVEHFRTKVSKGIEIMEHLRGQISGMAIPQFVIDSPGGKGKIPIIPTYLISQSPEKVVLRNYKGELVEYPEVS